MAGDIQRLAKRLIEELNRIVDAVYDSELISGFCYTQLSDVQQEINGLLDGGA